MDTWISVVVLCLITVLPGVLFAVFWWYIIKRGWGSRWLLAISITVFLSLISIVISLAAQEMSILFLGVGFSVLGGVLFYLFLKNSPLSDALIGKGQNLKSSPTIISEEERNSHKESAKLAIKDTLTIGFLQTLPLIIGLAIIVFSNDYRSDIMTSVGLFVMGFYGVLRITLRPKHVPAELYVSKGKIIGNIFVTVFAWSLALYSLVK
jgi:hypothetical protein